MMDLDHFHPHKAQTAEGTKNAFSLTRLRS